MRIWLAIAVGILPAFGYAEGVGQAALLGSAVVDVGRYPAHEAREAAFQLKNSGDGPLHMLKLRKGCGCTDARVDRTELAPGEVANIVLCIRAASLSGAYTKYAYVETSDSLNPMVRIGVAGEAAPLVDIRPASYVYGGRLSGDDPWTQTFSLSGDGVELADPEVESSHPVEVHLASVASHGVDRVYDLTVTVPPTTNTGSFACRIAMPVRAPSGHAPVTVTLSAKIGTDLLAIPRVMQIPLSETPYRRDIRLRVVGTLDRALDPRELVLPPLDQVTFTTERDPWQGLLVRVEFSPLFTERLSLTKRAVLSFSVPGASPAIVECRAAE